MTAGARSNKPILFTNTRQLVGVLYVRGNIVAEEKGEDEVMLAKEDGRRYNEKVKEREDYVLPKLRKQLWRL